MPKSLSLHQEVLLLALRDDKGTPAGGMYPFALAGAMISELLLRERIIANDDKKQTVAIVSDRSTHDEVLDDLLQKIDQAKKPRGLRDWVMEAARIRELSHRIARSLCELGILKADEKKILWVFTQRIYPEIDGTFEDVIRARMADGMFHQGVKPDSRTAVLIAISRHAGLLKQNFAPVELSQHKLRIKELANGQILAAGATQSAIQAAEAAIAVAATIPAVFAATSGAS